MNKIRFKWGAALAALLMMLGNQRCDAQSNVYSQAFTYQGYLTVSNAPASGLYNFMFRIYDGPINGETVGVTVVKSNVVVNSGVFTVQLDFGDNPLNNGFQWLDIAASQVPQEAHVPEVFTPLLPRQLITPVPYATFAFNAASANSVAFSNVVSIPGWFSSQGIAPAGISTTGASIGQTLAFDGTIAGWKDPIVLIANGTLPLSRLITSNALPGQVLSYDGTNAVWAPGEGFFLNDVNIAYINQPQTWGGSQTFTGAVSSVPTDPIHPPFKVGNSNRVDILNANYLEGRNSDSFWKVGGNTSVPPGLPGSIGTFNDAPLDFIVGGIRALRLQILVVPLPAPPKPLTVNVIAGSPSNSVAAGVQGAAIWGGGSEDSVPQSGLNFNAVTGDFGTVVGGAGNTAGAYSLAAGHGAQALHSGTFVWADDSASQNPVPAGFSTTASNQFLIRAKGGFGLNVSDPVPSGLSIDSEGTALELRHGSIRVTGAGLGTKGPVFIHRAVKNVNITDNFTLIDHALCNGDPNALLIITPNLNPAGPNHCASGVSYNGSKWTIVNLDGAPMADQSAFNVLIIKP